MERLKQQHVFTFLSPQQVNTLSEASQVVSLKPGEMVYERGQKADHFYVVLSGEVALRLPGKGSASVPIDDLTEGAMFGSCFALDAGSYFCTARCVRESELLKIPTGALKRVLDNDLGMGYAIQSRISQIYFKRYMNTMKKLQAIVTNIPIESE